MHIQKQKQQSVSERPMSSSNNPEQPKPQEKLSCTWSLGWSTPQQSGKSEDALLSPRIRKYHNSSQVQLQSKESWGAAREKAKGEKKQQTQDFFNQQLPNYDPRNGGKSSVHLGDDKVDYSHKNSYYSVRRLEKKNHQTHSQITFG